MPSISIAVLAHHLRAAGHEVLQYDLDILFHKSLKRAHPDVDFRLLTDQERVLDYLHGRLSERDAAPLRRIETLFADAARLEPCALYGITLVDMIDDLFVLHSAALLARAVRERFGAKVVIGYSGIPRASLRDMLERYPVFDYAVSGMGEVPMERLAERVAGREAALVATLVRSPGGVEEAVEPSPRLRCGGVDYEGQPLGSYRISADELLARYEPHTLMGRLRRMDKGLPAQLVVAYRFETTCRGRCSFCANDATVPSDRRGSAEIVEDLHRLQELGVTGVYFTNANFNNRYREADDLCDRMIRAGLRLQWSDCANFRELDEPLLAKFRRAGAVRLSFGMETGSPRLLRHIRKGLNLDRIERLLRRSHELGIWNHLEMIEGLPSETDADLEETIRFVRAHEEDVDLYALNSFFLYRSSPFYKEAARFGIRPHAEDMEGLWNYSRGTRRVGNVSERFDEEGGLAWAEKEAQIQRATRAVASVILAQNPTGGMNRDHMHLLMYLYGVLGHARKSLIRRMFRLATHRFMPYHKDHFPNVVELIEGIRPPAQGAGARKRSSTDADSGAPKRSKA